MKKFFLSKDFNLIDVATIITFVGEIVEGNFLTGFIIILVGAIISVELTMKFGDRE